MANAGGTQQASAKIIKSCFTGLPAMSAAGTVALTVEPDRDSRHQVMKKGDSPNSPPVRTRLHAYLARGDCGGTCGSCTLVFGQTLAAKDGPNENPGARIADSGRDLHSLRQEGGGIRSTGACAGRCGSQRARHRRRTSTGPDHRTGQPHFCSRQLGEGRSHADQRGHRRFHPRRNHRPCAGKEHGFHVHEVGECSLPDFKSAGEHFNPTKDPHGGPESKARHLGDIANAKADENGRATIDVSVKGATLGDKDAGPGEILGKALVVHAMPDDYKTQPSGGSGARIACGVIR